MWTLLPCNGGEPPSARALAGGLDGAFESVSAHLRASPFASKDRTDLQQLEKHCGTRYAQPQTVPEEMWASVRAMRGIDCLVLLPPDSAGGATAAGVDGVVFLSDGHGAIKGLPSNARAKAVLRACGRPREVHGDLFV